MLRLAAGVLPIAGLQSTPAKQHHRAGPADSALDTRTPLSKQQPGRGLSPPGGARHARGRGGAGAGAAGRCARPTSPPSTPPGGGSAAEGGGGNGDEGGEEEEEDGENPLAFLAMAASMEVGGPEPAQG
jgi:hypothetical protein